MGEGLIVRRGGSGGAKLRVLAVADAALLPENAKDGTVGFVSDTAAGTVYVQQDEPVGSFLVGDVWVRTGPSSDKAINIAQKGTLMVYVRECCQWDGTAFVSKATYVHENGAWVQTYLMLYQDGNHEQALTGGWGQQGNGTYIEYDDRLYLQGPSSYHATMVTSLPVDVTNYSKMEVIGAGRPNVVGSSAINETGAVRLVLRTTRTEGDVVVQTFTEAFTEGTVFTADISAVTGSYHVAVRAYNKRSCYVRCVRLLP